MHRRNRYREGELNIASLVSNYPQLEEYINDKAGRIQFRKKGVTNALTIAILKTDFDLDVHIPHNHLVPTVPLKLNYIHWIEDLMSCITSPHQIIRGVDIGTGPIAIHCLLCSKMHPEWKLYGTEIDKSSIENANTTILHNELTSNIKIFTTFNPNHTLEPAFSSLNDEGFPISFTMCNPPFFQLQDASTQLSKTSIKPALGHEVNTGTDSEMYCQGGELQFVKNIFTSSIEYGTKCIWYTTMFGHKSNWMEFKKFLSSNYQVSLSLHTSLRQGRTHRWASAWTFYPKSNFGPLPLPLEKRQIPNENASKIVHVGDSSQRNVIQEIQDFAQELDMKIESTTLDSITISTKFDTWTGRRKRRRMKSCDASQPRFKLLDHPLQIQFKVEARDVEMTLIWGQKQDFYNIYTVLVQYLK